MNINQAAGVVIRNRRHALGISARVCAERLEMPETTLRSYELASKRISLARFVAVCRGLGLNPVKALSEAIKLEQADKS